MKKQVTPVEYLMEQIPLGFRMYLVENGIDLEQALEMEKEHICMAYNDGRVNAGLKLNRTAQEYYTETYEKANSNRMA